jgi:hypothetical protein
MTKVATDHCAFLGPNLSNRSIQLLGLRTTGERPLGNGDGGGGGGGDDDDDEH